MQAVRVFTLFLSLIYFSSGLAKSQGVDVSYLTFDQFFQNYSMFNPASVDSSGKFLSRIGYSGLNGLFDGVNRMYFDADFKLGTKSVDSYSKIGSFVQSSNDGSFINRTRYYGRFSRTIKIGKEQFLSLGIAIGAVRISLKGSQTFAGGNSSVIDGYTGIWYHWNKFKVGVSLEQFPQSVLTPIQQSFKLLPILNLNAIYTSQLSSQVLLTNNLYYRKQNTVSGSFEYAPVLLMAEIVEAGANFKFGRGIAIMLGLRAYTVGEGKVSFMGSFLIGTRKLSTAADNKFEITARYSL